MFYLALIYAKTDYFLKFTEKCVKFSEIEIFKILSNFLINLCVNLKINASLKMSVESQN